MTSRAELQSKAPVYRPGVTARAVYPPDGLWYDLRTGRRSTGPRTNVAEADLATIPVYACGGVVVPLCPFLQYTDERPVDPLTLEVSPDAAGGPSGVLYEDGGHSFDYEQGAWRLTHYTQTPAGSSRQGVPVAKRAGAFEPPPRAVEVRVHTDAEGGLFWGALPEDRGTWQLATR